MPSDVTPRSRYLHLLSRIFEFVVGIAIGAFGAWVLWFLTSGLSEMLSIWVEAIPPALMSAVAVVLYLRSNLKALAVGIVLGAVAETIFFIWLFATIGKGMS